MQTSDSTLVFVHWSVLSTLNRHSSKRLVCEANMLI